VPGGKNPDGTALFGWNDIGAAYCARCGHRDTAHVILKDLPDAEEELRRLMIQRQAQKPHPLAATLDEPTGTQMSGARVPVRVATTRAVPTGTGTTGAEAGPLAQPSPLQMYELEPGVADPLAASAYAYARAQHEEQKAARMRAAVEEAREERAAVEKAKAEVARANAVTVANGGDETAVRAEAENAAFKAEVERMVKESASAPPHLETLAALTAPVPAGVASTVSEMLRQINLPQYTQTFEDEGMEMSVLISLARGDGKAALDDALKEAGVTSVGHRLKIFAALQ